MLLLGILIGVLVGTVATWILLTHGWKPALVLALVLAGAVFLATARADLSGTVAGAVLVSFAVTRFVAEPLLKRHLPQ